MRLLHVADGELLGLCARGEAEAWRELVEAYGGLVAGTVQRILERRGSPEVHHEVEEVVGDFFGDLWMHRAALGRFRGECSVRAFLAVLAANYARTRALRMQRGRDRVATYLHVADGGAMLGGPRETGGQSERIASALELCAARDKLLFRLLYVEEASVDQACAVLGISRDALYLRKYRFHRRMRNLWQART